MAKPLEYVPVVGIICATIFWCTITLIAKDHDQGIREITIACIQEEDKSDFCKERLSRYKP